MKKEEKKKSEEGGLSKKGVVKKKKTSLPREQKMSKAPNNVNRKVEESNRCHQCLRNDRPGELIRCKVCPDRRFCQPCVRKWYPDVTLESFEEACAVCSGNCMCKACLRKYQREVEESNRCHQCLRNIRPGELIRCKVCPNRRFCQPCVRRWYPDVTVESFEEACAVCSGNCMCKACLRKYAYANMQM